MKNIESAYVNALLADAAYVTVSINSGFQTNLETRMTPTQASFIAANFEVRDSVTTPGILDSTGFDAVVWKGKAGSDYAGKTYLSIRGTQGKQDLLDDADLAFAGVPYKQLVSMVNWWLKSTTASGQALQIRTDANNNFVFAPTVAATGTLKDVTSIESVNAHSLGGYMATAFTRLFGQQLQVQGVNTFNSAGFSRLQTNYNITNSFNQISQLIGTGLGFNNFDDVAIRQNNFFARNGINFTTNDWDPVGFTQYGQRVGLFQEDEVKATDGGITNHFMYKLTDALAIGSAIEKLDSSFTFAKLETIMPAGSNIMSASYEGILDGLRRIVLGNSIPATQVGDVSDSAASRKDFHANLKNLVDLFAEPNGAFKSLAGKLTITLPDSTLAAKAKTDFASFLSLNALSPVVISTTDEAALTALKTANPALSTAWTADKNARLYGDTTKVFDYSDNWYEDRTALLQAITTRNKQDSTNGFVFDPAAPAGQATLFQWYGAEPLARQTQPGLATLLTKNTTAIGLPDRLIAFGDDGSNRLDGLDNNKLGDRLYGTAANDINNRSAA